jgi:hypothetical protein
VIHALHWDFLSSGSLKAIDVARGIEEMIFKTAERQGDKIVKDTMEKVKKKANSRLVVVGAKGGKDLTVIDGVHRAVRICLHYMVRENKPTRQISQ